VVASLQFLRFIYPAIKPEGAHDRAFPILKLSGLIFGMRGNKKPFAKNAEGFLKEI